MLPSNMHTPMEPFDENSLLYLIIPFFYQWREKALAIFDNIHAHMQSLPQLFHLPQVFDSTRPERERQKQREGWDGHTVILNLGWNYEERVDGKRWENCVRGSQRGAVRGERGSAGRGLDHERSKGVNLGGFHCCWEVLLNEKTEMVRQSRLLCSSTYRYIVVLLLTPSKC